LVNMAYLFLLNKNNPPFEWVVLFLLSLILYGFGCFISHFFVSKCIYFWNNTIFSIKNCSFSIISSFILYTFVLQIYFSLANFTTVTFCL
jgi:hypothetical protein